LYAVDLKNTSSVDYQQYLQDEWKLNLFSHYLGVLYCCDTEEGRKIISGAVIKTNAAHPSEQENIVVMRLIERSPKLKEVHTQRQ
ncbi:YjeJ family protein, partial [Klebsiella pneumoniae]